MEVDGCMESIRVTIRVPSSVLEALDGAAEFEGSRAAVLQEALYWWLVQEGYMVLE